MIEKDERYTPQSLKDNFWNGTVDNDVKVECLEVKKDEQLSIVDNNGICKKSIKYCLYRALKDFTDRTETKKEGVESFGPIKNSKPWIRQVLWINSLDISNKKDVKTILTNGITKCVRIS